MKEGVRKWSVCSTSSYFSSEDSHFLVFCYFSAGWLSEKHSYYCIILWMQNSLLSWLSILRLDKTFKLFFIIRVLESLFWTWWLPSTRDESIDKSLHLSAQTHLKTFFSTPALVCQASCQALKQSFRAKIKTLGDLKSQNSSSNSGRWESVRWSDPIYQAKFNFLSHHMSL